MADLSQYIDQYCERLAPGLLAEPLNLYSNLSFIIFACLGFYEIQTSTLTQPEKRSWSIAAGIVFMVGIGSALFHSFATVWAKYADVTPIAILLFTFIGMHVRVSLKLSWWKTLAALVGFLALTAGAAVVVDPKLVNGSNQYFGTTIALFVMGGDCWRRKFKTSQYCFFAAGGTFILSLVFRSIDLKICAAWPLGTHFLWHMLNGLTIYFAFLGTIKVLEPRNSQQAQH